MNMAIGIALAMPVRVGGMRVHQAVAITLATHNPHPVHTARGTEISWHMPIAEAMAMATAKAMASMTKTIPLAVGMLFGTTTASY